jgi:hypothetical protein
MLSLSQFSLSTVKFSHSSLWLALTSGWTDTYRPSPILRALVARMLNLGTITNGQVWREARASVSSPTWNSSMLASVRSTPRPIPPRTLTEFTWKAASNCACSLAVVYRYTAAATPAADATSATIRTTRKVRTVFVSRLAMLGRRAPPPPVKILPNLDE